VSTRRKRSEKHSAPKAERQRHLAMRASENEKDEEEEISMRPRDEPPLANPTSPQPAQVWNRTAAGLARTELARARLARG